MLSSLSSVPLSNISNGRLSNEAFLQVKSVADQLKTAPIFINEKIC